ncbi:MAG: type II toxin-antitoxin system VapC family toxin [Mycobacteriales bacterium]
MIVDSSALVAVVFDEPGAADLVRKLADSPATGVGTPTLAETGLVLSVRLDKDPRDLLMRLLDEFSITEVPFGPAHWREAIIAFRRFGRGRHPARLNYGDCMSYAVSKLAGEPLLFVGEDFPATDIEVA